jgi:putative transposase
MAQGESPVPAARVWLRGRSDRPTHFSVQRDHLHLIVEAAEDMPLARGMQAVSSRVALAVNRALGRRGPLWRDRYHRHDLTTPRLVRNSIVYVLMNFRKHGPEDCIDTLDQLDSRSSAQWFDGWDPRAGPLLDALLRRVGANADAVAPITPARTWLGARGWRRLGPIRPEERPATGARA